jgi:hypothetical protein
LSYGRSNYNESVYYSSYDVTGLVQFGDAANRLVVLVGNGFYNVRGRGRAAAMMMIEWRSRVMVAMMIVVTTTMGSRRRGGEDKD